MRLDFKIALYGLCFGFGITIVAMVLPLRFPNLPPIILDIMLFGGGTVALGSLLLIIYELFIRPRLIKEVKMIPLSMIIFGVLLIIGGIIYHMYDKKPQLIKLSSSKQLTAKEIASEVAKTLPPPMPQTGNLKERAIALSDEIVKDPKFQNEPIWAKDGLAEWVKNRSNYFKWKYLARVHDIHNELSQLHLRNRELDDFVKHHRVIKSAQEWQQQQNEFPILPQEYWRVAESLRELADKIPAQ